MKIQHFFHEPTSTLTYVVHTAGGRGAVIIDPVRDYDAASGRTSWGAAEQVARYLDDRRLRPLYVIDTHAHADHLSGLPFFRERYGARTVTGNRVGTVQRAFRDLFDLGADFPVDGRQFDILLDEGDRLAVGDLVVQALHTPGHTPAHMSWKMGDALFAGDTLFMPDYGTARCDFPGGDAGELYDSIQRLYALPDATRVFVCHDYQPEGRELRFEATLGEHKRGNVQLDATTTREDYVAFRDRRDRELDMPALILPAVQVNVRGGALPPPGDNGVAYLKIPLNRF